MINAITHSRIYVTDQDEALDFYVGKLGMEVSADVDMGNMRWLTVRAPGNENHNILLEKANAPFRDPDTVEHIQQLLSKGHASMAIITTDDCRAEYARLVEAGVEGVEEPVERFYGIDAGFRDPFGNHLRLTEPKSMPEGIDPDKPLTANEDATEISQ